MVKAPSVRIHFTDGTSMDLPENDSIQLVTAGPEGTPQEGWTRLNGDSTPAQFGKLMKSRPAVLKQGQKLLTFRGVLEVDGARRV